MRKRALIFQLMDQGFGFDAFCRKHKAQLRIVSRMQSLFAFDLYGMGMGETFKTHRTGGSAIIFTSRFGAI